MARSGTKKKRPKRSAPKTDPSFLRKLGLLIAILSALLYLNTLGHQYALDDYSVIKENYVTQRGLEGIPTLLTTHLRYGYWNAPGVLYRPVPMVMFAVEWAIAPDSPWLSHLINILLYALTGWLLLVVLHQWLRKYHIIFPLLITLFFVAHPVHTEVVANIKSRDEILAFFFALGAFHFLWNYLEKTNPKWLLLALGSFTLAQFSKETAITFLAVFPLALYFFSSSGWDKILKISALFAFPALFYLLIRAQILGSFTGIEAGTLSVLDNFLTAAPDTSHQMATAFLLLGKYLLVLIFPHPLSHEYGFDHIAITHWTDWRVLLSLLAYLFMGIFALVKWRQRSPLAFAILLFLATLSISSNLLILTGTSYAERFLYVPSLGFTIVLAWLVCRAFATNLKPAAVNFTKLWNHSKRPILLSLVILTLYSFKTISRNLAWYDSYTLYKTDVNTATGSAKLHYHYGLELAQQSLKAEDGTAKQQLMENAVAEYQRAIEIYPQYHDAYAQLGLAYYRAKAYPEAMQHYQTALRYKPNDAKVHSNMGVIYFEQGQLAEAKRSYEMAIQADPRFVDALRNLGVVYAQEKDFNAAIRYFSEALKYAPDDATINYYLGMAFRDSGNAAAGESYLQKAYQLNPALRK